MQILMQQELSSDAFVFTVRTDNPGVSNDNQFMLGRVFDVKDVTIMIKLNIVFLIILSIRILIIDTYTF